MSRTATGEQLRAEHQARAVLECELRHLAKQCGDLLLDEREQLEDIIVGLVRRNRRERAALPWIEKP